MRRARKTSGLSSLVPVGNQFFDGNGAPPGAGCLQSIDDRSNILNILLDSNDSSDGQAAAGYGETLSPLHLAEQLGKAGFGLVRPNKLHCTVLPVN